MSEQGKQAKGQKETGQDQQGKSKVDKLIDKAQEKGLTDKVANIVKNKFKGR